MERTFGLISKHAHMRVYTEILFRSFHSFQKPPVCRFFPRCAACNGETRQEMKNTVRRQTVAGWGQFCPEQ